MTGPREKYFPEISSLEAVETAKPGGSAETAKPAPAYTRKYHTCQQPEFIIQIGNETQVLQLPQHSSTMTHVTLFNAQKQIFVLYCIIAHRNNQNRHTPLPQSEATSIINVTCAKQIRCQPVARNHNTA